MPSTNLYYRLRIFTDTTLATEMLRVTSVRAGTNPYLVAAPVGDGASFNPLTGESMLGSYTVRIADWPIGGSPLQRVLTSKLEDANFRQQLAYRPAWLDMGTDGTTFPVTLVNGVLSLLRLIDAMTYEASVQDPMRWMQQTTLFSPGSSVLMTDWFRTWPLRGCIAGGPIMTTNGAGTGVGSIGIQDLGGWQMRVESYNASNGQYVLRPHVVYGPGNWNANTRSNLNDFADVLNAAAQRYFTNPLDVLPHQWQTVNDAYIRPFSWTNLTWLINSGSGWYPYKPYPFAPATWIYPDGQVQYQWPLVSNLETSGNWGVGVIQDQTAGASPVLSVGSLVRCRALNVLPTTDSPLYLTGHPCDLLAQIWTSVRLPYDSSALTTIQSSGVIGSDMQMTFRLTEAKAVTELVTQIVEPFGVGLRGNDAGQIQVFDGRLGGPSVTVPSITISAADVIDGTTKLPYELDPSQSAYLIKFQQNRYSAQHTVQYGQNGIVDGVVTGTDQLTLYNATDPGAIQFGSIDWNTEGFISSLNAKVSWAQFVVAQALTIFNRFGRGGLALETTLLRGGAGDSLRLGDEALIALPQLPNHNYRLGDNPATAARRMQIVQRTVLPEGYSVRFQDSGPNTQPIPLVPVLTIALAASQGRNVAVVTITNAATINASYGARLQMAVTLDGSTPPAGQFVDVTAWGVGTVPTTAIQLPPAQAGATVWARARCEAPPPAPPQVFGNYSVPVGVLLSPVNPPSGLTITPTGTDGSLALLKWTPGAGTTADLVDIWLRASGLAFALATRIQVLNPGSVQYLIEGLTPGTSYVASVQYRDATTGMTSAAVDISFTAGATQRTLSAPVDPQPFAGIIDPKTGAPNRDGTFGIAVLAAEFPGSLEVQVALETAVGAGTYGAMTTQAVAPAIGSVLGNWTKAMFVAPNDGLRRQLHARHVADGCTPSAYCATVTVLPWTPLPLGPLPTALILEVTALDAGANDGINFRFQVDCVDPYGQTTQVALASLTGTGVAIVTGPALGVFSPNDTIWEVSLPTSGGPGSMVVQGKSADGRLASLTMTLPPSGGAAVGIPQGTVSVDQNGNWQATIDVLPNVKSLKYLVSTTAFPLDTDVESGGTLVENPVALTLSSPSAGAALTFGQTIYITIVPYGDLTASTAPLVSIHLRGAYLSYTPTKTTTYGATTWMWAAQDSNQPLGWSGSSPWVNSWYFGIPTWASNTSYWGLPVVLPNNVTLTSVSLNVPQYSLGSSYDVVSVTFRMTRNGTSIGTANVTGGGSWPIGLSESSTGRAYQAQCEVNSLRYTGTGIQLGPPIAIGEVAVTYTMTNPATTV